MNNLKTQFPITLDLLERYTEALECVDVERQTILKWVIITNLIRELEETRVTQ